LLACLYWLVRLDASQIEQRYGSPILLPSRPELLVLLAVGRAASAAPSGRHPGLDALALHGEIKEESAGQPERGRPTILGPSILVPWRPAERHLPCSFVPACAFRRRSTASCRIVNAAGRRGQLMATRVARRGKPVTNLGRCSG
jgi:hypothetical protein